MQTINWLTYLLIDDLVPPTWSQLLCTSSMLRRWSSARLNSCYLQAFSVLGPRLWNSLPIDCCVTLATTLLALDILWRHSFSQSTSAYSTFGVFALYKSMFIYVLCVLCHVSDQWRQMVECLIGDTAAAAPPPFRLGDPAFCGSHPLVTPYYCRLGDLLCFVFMSVYCMFDLSVYYLFLQYFDTVGWVFWPVKLSPI